MPEARKQNIDLPFPVGGIVDGAPHSTQPPNTTHDSKNVLPFDAEEGRGRGGRRGGVKKVSNQAMSIDPVQLLLPVGVTVSSGELVTGAVSEYPSDHAEHAGVQALLDYSDLPDGTSVNSGTLGYQLYGSAYSTASQRNETGSGWGLLSEASNHHTSFGATNYGEAFLFGQNSASNLYYQLPVVIHDSLSGVIKKTDSDGAAYIEINPSRFLFGRADSDGSFNSVISCSPELLHSRYLPGSKNQMESASSRFNNVDTGIQVSKHFMLLPKHEYDESPWNVAPGKKYATRMEFQLPNAPSHVYPGSTVTFAETLADETAGGEGYLYDPWYTYCATAGGIVAYQEDAKNTFKPFLNWEEKIGLIFRVGADYGRIADESLGEWWWSYHKNGVANPTNQLTYLNAAALCVYLERSPADVDGDISSANWDLKAHTVVNSRNHAWGDVPTAPQTGITIAENVISGSNREYHTLEVKFDGQRMDVFLNGVNKYSNGNIGATFETLVSVAGDTVINDYGYGGIFYASNQRIVRTASAGGSSYNTVVKQQVGYFCSRDWDSMSDPDGNTVASTHTDDRGGGTAWRLRSLEHRELSSNPNEDRVVLAITGGKAYESNALGSFVSVSSDQVLNTNAAIVDGVTFFTKAYLVDGRNYKVYDPVTNVASDWDTHEAQTEAEIFLPGGNGAQGEQGSGTYDENPRCTIIEIFNGRVVMAGKSDEANNWFMSAIADPLDWDISQTIADGGAVTGTSGSIGEASEYITALAPMDGDRLLIAGASTISMLTGDPSSPSTQLVNVSRHTGIVGQNAWCYGPNKTVYFVGENGLYSVAPNEFDITEENRVSLGKLDKTFLGIDFSTYNCKLVYDHMLHGIHIFLNPTQQKSNPTIHYYYDTRANSFWLIELPSVIGPTSVTNYPALDPSARGILMGGYDGFVRTFSDDAKDDDGTAVDSYTWIGPLMISSDREAKLSQLIAVLDEQTTGLDYEIYAADTVEAAKNGTPIVTGAWAGGRNPSNRMRVRGSAVFVKIKSSDVALPWSLEKITATLAVAGRVRQR